MTKRSPRVRARANLVKTGTPTASRMPAAIDASLFRSGMDNVSLYGPGRPLTPTQGYSQTPRAMDYPMSINIGIQTRTMWGRTPYEVLKSIIDAYDVARMCINHKIDELRSMEPMFVAADGYQGHDIDMAVDAARAALAFPDREHPYIEWVSLLLETALRYDATPLYNRRNLAGDIIGFEVIDGPTVLPYIDENGRRPRPPAPAYYQVVHGQVMDWYTSEDVSFNRFRPQTDSPFGLAPMESILLTANTDIRFQWHFLQMFTDGSVPNGFVELPPDVSSPTQVREWQEYWDSMVLGDQAKLHQLLAVPQGTKLTQTRPAAFDKDFPQYLMMRTAAAFQVVPQDLGLIDDVNRANGETQTDMQFRVNTLPWVLWLQGILTRYVQSLGLPIQVNLDTGRDKQDRLEEAEAWKIATEGGAVSVDEWRSEVYGLPIDNERPMPRFIMGKGGPIPIMNVLQIAGPTDPETAAPVDGIPLSTEPYTGADGVMPDKIPGGTEFKRSPVNPDEPEFPELEHPIPGSDVVGTKPAAPVIGDPGVPAVKEPVGKEATAGFTAATGVTGHDLVGADDDTDEDEETPLPAELAKVAERASFKRFVKARRKRGKWSDFEFTSVDAITAHRLNDAGRAEVRKDAGELVAAGLCVRAADTGRVLMLQRGLDPADPASGMWEFPGGGIEGDEDALAAAWREWQEETGCLIPAGTTVGETWAASNGIYQGYIASVPTETSIPIGARGQVINPDDPDGDWTEALAWWDPSLLLGNPAIRNELSADLPLVLEALQPADVVKAGDARPKVPSWRDGAPKTPQHKFDLRLTDHYRPLLTDAIGNAFPAAALRSAIESAAAAVPVVKSAPGPDDPTTQAIREAAKASLAGGNPDTAALETLLRQLYAEAFAAGGHAAGTQIGGTAVTLDGVDSIDWATWEPGNLDAAIMADNGGLAALLDNAGITIQSVEFSLIDQLGNRIADGLLNGDPVDTVADSLGGILDDPARAEMIAHTETARAVDAATMATYAANDLDEYDVILSDDACDDCVGEADANPHQVSDGGVVPVHPYCRCSSAPTIPAGWTSPAGDQDQDEE